MSIAAPLGTLQTVVLAMAVVMLRSEPGQTSMTLPVCKVALAAVDVLAAWDVLFLLGLWAYLPARFLRCSFIKL